MNDKNSPQRIKLHDVQLDADYVHWLSEIKARYRKAQIKAKVHVCAEQLQFNWELGRDLVQKKAEERWGSGVVEQVSLDLQAAFPESKGFSVTNLYYMKQWYQFYTSEPGKLPQVVGELHSPEKQIDVRFPQVEEELFNQKVSQVRQKTKEDVPFPNMFALVPWGHHREIISKCKSIDEALFYICHTISRGWSRNALMNCIKSDLYHTEGKAITNFAVQLPSPQSDLAQAITKDTYDFGFLTLEDGYQEGALEMELERQLTRFLLELGTGFAYMGRQQQIIVAGKTRKLDMLFFHIPLNCYVVVELKVVPFQPEFAGKLNFYVSAVDDLIRTPAQNPTIGLLICADKDETEVRYAFRGVHTPIGVASYDNIQIKKIQDHLPSVEELKQRIRLLEEQLRKTET